jgi:adenylate cyclase
MQGWRAVSDSESAEAVLLARHAIEAGRDDPDALWMAGFTIALLAGDHSTALAAIDRALAVNPNSALAWSTRGWVLAFRNQPIPAIEAHQQAIRLSPLDPLAYFFAAGLAFGHMVAERYEQAIEWADRTSHAQPRFVQAMRCKLVCLAHLGRTDDTSDWLKRVLALQPGLTIAAWTGYYASTAVFSPEVLARIVDGYRRPACRRNDRSVLYDFLIFAAGETSV